ncbi:Nudix family hydrolase [Thiomicrorhabdus aquaedulcis]|uniref:Nudix family hydrolase n=1 Tax=Thiomicrorhabdus aquaedulcis TaxID=2211106 RepID=UPI000FDC44AC|nr:Nudix family hydrolase [Thiomicrorhabdus aquaedulcis]
MNHQTELNPALNNEIAIAVGVLIRGSQVCLSVRQSHQTHADHWEFPGGKVHANETIEQALVREFNEELAIETRGWQPLIEIPWAYDALRVRLHVYQTEDFSGEPMGNEGQAVAWCERSELKSRKFPAANKGIVSALTLADHLMISGAFDDESDALKRLQQACEAGVRFCQLRAKHLPQADFVTLANRAIDLVHGYGGKILLNADPAILALCPMADGVQLASNALEKFTQRPIADDKWLGASTHNVSQMQHALALGADFILLSPIKPTRSHPDMQGIGWSAFAQAVREIPVPVYALGGMQPTDIDQAKSLGGQGIAAISGFWPG